MWVDRTDPCVTRTLASGSSQTRLGARFDPDPIVNGCLNPLPGPQVLLGGLDRDMAEQKLNLVKLPARTPAEPGAGSPQIVWRERVNASLGRSGLHDVPNGLLAEPLAADPAKPTDLAKDFPVL